MTSSDDQLLEGITLLTPALLTTLDAFEQVQRNMHPTRLDQLANLVSPFEAELASAFEPFQSLTFPDHIAKFGDLLKESTTYALRACDGIVNANGDAMAAFKAMRAQIRAQEKLYPIANVLRPISQYFLELPKREDNALLEALAAERDDVRVGILHAANNRDARGGFSLYVPENINPENKVPIVIAMHGGTGHGADFLWSWLREARTRGFILLTPTSQGDTWSLMEEDIDLPVLTHTLQFIADNYAVDLNQVLLTGMSDGGTYTLLAGLKENSPFTHLAPFSGVLHPEISMSGDIRHAEGRSIYLVHGTHDWMFPVETAHMAQAELEAAGANLTFRVIEGLSHTYARDENSAVLDWFSPELSIT